MPAADFSNIIAELDRDYVPYLSVNSVIFGAHQGSLQVLLMQSAGTGTWSLPGGYVRRAESIDDAAARVLLEMTGLSATALRQFHTFGGPARGEAVVADALHAMGIDVPADHWVLGRVVSIGYVALVDATLATVTPNAFSRAIEWCDVTKRPPLIIDHDEMVARALASLRAHIDDLLIDANVLPEAFTMPELQRVHETVLGRPLDRRNFQKRILELGLVERLPDLRVGGRCKPTYMYRWVTRAG
jgi:ADP-ribose pyrophosphatase YjhB (NUDIX family)